jgi:hypothetical protein
VSRARDMAGRVAAAIQGRLDTINGTTYEPRSIGDSREVTGREKTTYQRWRAGAAPRNTYERDAFRSFPREVTEQLDYARRRDAEVRAQRAAEDREAGQ